MKKRKRKKLYVFAAFIIVIFICFSLFLNGVVYPVVIEYAQAEIKNMTVTAVNKAILSVFSGSTNYSDLVEINTDTDGNVSYIKADTIKINSLAQNTARVSKQELDKIGEEVLKIPIGTLTKSPLLTGIGPSVSVRILSAGSVLCRFKSVFTGEGINQTMHKIYIEVCARMDIIMPASHRNIESTIEIFVAEAVIAGKVPEAFLNIGAFDRINLLP